MHPLLPTLYNKKSLNKLFASTAQGLEELLKNELQSLGADNSKVVQGGVYFQADDRLLYRTLLWSRLASRIFLPLNEFQVNDDQDLYLGAQAIDWPAIFTVDKTFVVHFTGVNHAIQNSQYGALKVKDAIVDRFISKVKQRPSVTKQQPDISIHVFLRRDIPTALEVAARRPECETDERRQLRDSANTRSQQRSGFKGEGYKVVISLDLSGNSLHQRGYRDSSGGQAPLKENLAAAIILRAGWQKGTPLIDPMCGSGTLLIEAAMMATDHAPGLHRQQWGFSAWRDFNHSLWSELMSEAQARASKGLKTTPAYFFGADADPQTIKIARANAERAGVASLIRFQPQDLSQLANPWPTAPAGGVISNPPYGERLESEPVLIALYNLLGRIMKTAFAGWRLSLFSASPTLINCVQLRAEREFKAKNGALDCIQKNYQLSAYSEQAGQKETLHLAKDFANRLGKNKHKLDKWAQQQGIECYRLYDADLPEYNVAIDRYGSKIVLQEYAAPKTIDAKKARQRLFDAIHATLQVLAIPANQLVIKTRERQKGKNQYQKLAQRDEFFLVQEYNAKLWVNLTDYLDTGLFLDHRITRQMLGKMSQGKDFLNLFAYTGAASVHAGLGGAKSTTTVDMSHTYLAWAEKNLRTNGLTGRQHRLIQADCFAWLDQRLDHPTAQFDVIFIDPPTFSNSKRMANTFDVQRDHLPLMKAIKPLLRPNGTMIFSNNRHGFKIDVDGITALGLTIKEITAKTQSPDFARHRQIHHCWLITHTGEEKLCH